MRVILIYNWKYEFLYPPFAMTSAALQGGFVAAPAARQSQWQPEVQRTSLTTLGLVVLAHVGALFALQSMGVMTAPVPPVPLMVDLIENQVEAPKAPVLKPPKPVITPKQKPVVAPVPVPRMETPVLATESNQPAPAFEVAKVEKAPPAPITPTVAAVAPSAPPVQPSAPRFDADYLNNPSPEYPPLSKNAREEGKVFLNVFVEPTGVPSKIEVRKSSGFERLDKSAERAVRRWKFVPAKLGGEAVAAWVVVPVNFSLKD